MTPPTMHYVWESVDEQQFLLRMRFRAIDGDEHDLTTDITSDYYLWNTGAHGFMISDYMFNEEFQACLEVHRTTAVWIHYYST